MPAISMVPPSGVSNPAKHLKIVVFPHPLGPNSAKVLPRGTSNETLRTAV